MRARCSGHDCVFLLQLVDVIFPLMDWTMIFPLNTTNVSVTISYAWSAVCALHTIQAAVPSTLCCFVSKVVPGFLTSAIISSH